jgi:hypothetical protein
MKLIRVSIAVFAVKIKTAGVLSPHYPSDVVARAAKCEYPLGLS